MKNKKLWIILIITAFGAYYLGQHSQYRKGLYEGHDAAYWAHQYSVTYGKYVEADIKAKNLVTPKLTIDDLVRQTPTPTSKPATEKAGKDSVLPYWCDQIIEAFMAEGYSRATTNQLMKKDSPECTYN